MSAQSGHKGHADHDQALPEVSAGLKDPVCGMTVTVHPMNVTGNTPGVTVATTL